MSEVTPKRSDKRRCKKEKVSDSGELAGLVHMSLASPSFGEAGSLPELTERIVKPLTGRGYEIICGVDDSTDNTWEEFVDPQ